MAKNTLDLENAVSNLKDIIKIKESMLEDQNSTIKTLKLNLENKSREFQNLAKELDHCNEALEELEKNSDRDRKQFQQQVFHIKLVGRTSITAGSIPYHGA